MKYVIAAVFAVVVSLAFSPKAFAITGVLNQDVPTDPCGSIDASTPCYETGSSTTCQQGTGYDACKTYCTCVYKQNIKKCGTNITCQDIANAEKDACLGNCITDWA